MHKIVEKHRLAEGYKFLVIHSPRIASRIQPGQFVVLRVHEKGERIPMTVSDFDRERGTLNMVVHEMGKTSKLLASLEPGEEILNMLGPLGQPSEIEYFGRVVTVCRQGTSGALYSIMKALKEKGNRVTCIMGAKSRHSLILEEEVERVVDELIVATDDGSKGRKGFALAALREYLEENRADYILTIGPSKMMKNVGKVGKKQGIKTMASLGAIMLDGTGMCGSCRVTVKDSTLFACVHGPEFEASEVDFDELIRRQSYYRQEEKLAMEIFEEGR